jgi:hypothetical protein
MNGETPAHGRGLADAHDVGADSTAHERHGGRFANVTVQGMRRLTLRRLGLFDMSYAVGRYFDQHGSFKRLNGLPVGAVVDASRLPDVLELAGVTEKTWENNVSSWVRLRMAHRCRPGVVALFMEPLDGAGAICPKCHRPLERAASLPAPGSVSPALREDSSRLAGESEHESLVASNAERTVVGTAAVPKAVGSQLREDPSQEGSSEIARRIEREREFGLADRDIAALLNGESIQPPAGFFGWTGYAVRVVLGEAARAA